MNAEADSRREAGFAISCVGTTLEAFSGPLVRGRLAQALYTAPVRRRLTRSVQACQ